jgi:hypothetical protein
VHSRPCQLLAASCTSHSQAAQGGTTTYSSTIQQLFGRDWQSIQPEITPKAAELAACNEAVEARQHCLKSGTAKQVGSAAADLHLPGCDADIVVLLPGLTPQNHAAELAAVAAAVKGHAGQQQGFSSVRQDDFNVECNRQGINIDIVIGTVQSASPSVYMQQFMTDHQRRCLSASTAVATAAFLSFQAPLFKAAVRLVKHWAQQLHGQDWSDQLCNRWGKSVHHALVVHHAGWQLRCLWAYQHSAGNLQNTVSGSVSLQRLHHSVCHAS